MIIINQKFLNKCYGLAENLINSHITWDENNKCNYFNLFTYLNDLENELNNFIYDWQEKNNYNFDLDGYQVARFIWCLISENPYPDKFRGMPVLD